MEQEFENACRDGDLELVNSLIEKGLNSWNAGLYDACMCGHMEIVQLMIQKGASNWNVGLRCACAGGYMEIVKLMIAKGADDWNQGLLDASRGGHLEIVKLMIAKGANDREEGLWYACEGGHREIVELVVQGTNIVTYQQFIELAERKNHKDIVYFLSLREAELELNNSIKEFIKAMKGTSPANQLQAIEVLKSCNAEIRAYFEE